MDFKLTDEQQLLLESVEEFILKSGYDEAYLKKCWEENRIPSEYLDDLTKAGFGTLGLPEEYGGVAIDTVTMMLFNEKTNALGFPNRLAAMLEVDDMLTFANQEQQKTIFDIVATGKKAFCLGFTEPQAGSDSLAITANAVRRNGKVYLNGHKCFITAADIAKYMLTITRDIDSPLPPHRAISMWLVPLDKPGIKVEVMHKVGWRLQGSLCDVYLDNVEIEEKDLVGQEGNGFIQLMKNFEVERLLMASNAMGTAVCAYNDALQYAVLREQFGKPLKEFQLIQDKIVNMAIKIENMRNFVYRCAWLKDQGRSIQTEANLCKIYCSRAAFEVCDEAVQIFGGIGYTEEHRVSRLWRDVRLNRIGGGTDEILIRAAAKQLFKIKVV
jgi:alkylation response protein AidB-like acyl-CoA dehydrogenase